MKIKKFDVELISDVITSLKNVSNSEIGKIALYFWYFSVDKENALSQYIARLARYAFFMGMNLKSDFETLYPNETEETMKHFLKNENFETFFKKWENEITFSPFEELFTDEIIDGNA